MTPARRVAALTGLGAILRLRELVDRPLWLDEAITANAALAPDPFAAVVATDGHPPGLVMVLAPLLALWPTDLVARLPSYLAGVATVPATAWAARRWDGRPELAASLAAALPPWVAYAGEARPYALGLLLAVLLTGEAAAPRTRVLGALSVAAVGTLYGLWPVVTLATGVAFARGRPGPALIAVAAAVVVGLGFAVGQWHLVGASPGALDPFLASPATAPAFLAVQLPSWLGWTWTGFGGDVALAAGALAVLGLVWRARCTAWDGLAAIVAGSVGLAAFLGTVGVHPFGATRHALVLGGPLVIWLSRGPAIAPWTVAAVALGLAAGLARAPRLPTEDVPTVLVATPGPRLLDASVAPAARWYGATDPAVPWVRGEALAQALDARAPPGGFWWVAGRTRPGVDAAVIAWAASRGLAPVEHVDAPGVRAVRLAVSAPDRTDAP